MNKEQALELIKKGKATKNKALILIGEKILKGISNDEENDVVEDNSNDIVTTIRNPNKPRIIIDENGEEKKIGRKEPIKKNRTNFIHDANVPKYKEDQKIKKSFKRSAEKRAPGLVKKRCVDCKTINLVSPILCGSKFYKCNSCILNTKR